MNIRVFKAEKKEGKLVVFEPWYLSTIRSMLLEVKNNKPLESIYLVYPMDIESMIDPELYSHFSTATFAMFEEDPRAFGVLVYKDEDGKIKFE